MKVYHGSLEIVEHPKILPPNRTLAYGTGFYTTTSEKQATEWVKRRMMEKHSISIDTLIHELKTYKLVGQYLFHTEKALTALNFIEAIKIE